MSLNREPWSETRQIVATVERGVNLDLPFCIGAPKLASPAEALYTSWFIQVQLYLMGGSHRNCTEGQVGSPLG
jgi:hypothetical protein